MEDVSPRSLVLVSIFGSAYGLCMDGGPAVACQAASRGARCCAPTWPGALLPPPLPANHPQHRSCAWLPTNPPDFRARWAPPQVDELGKGTEVRAGASLAGALVEELDAARCRGIFATHLHALLDLELRWGPALRLGGRARASHTRRRHIFRAQPGWHLVGSLPHLPRWAACPPPAAPALPAGPPWRPGRKAIQRMGSPCCCGLGLWLLRKQASGCQLRRLPALPAGVIVSRVSKARPGHPHTVSCRLTGTEFYQMETETVELEAAEEQGYWLGGDRDQLAASYGGGGDTGALPRALSVARRPTWRIKPGVCTESLALDVARRCRLPPSVVARAAQLYEQLPPLVPRVATAAAAAAPLAPWDMPLGTAAEAGAAAAAPAAAGGQPEAGAVPARRAARGRRSNSSSSSNGAPVDGRWTIEAAAAAVQQVAQDALASLPQGADVGAEHALQVSLPGFRLGLACT